MTEESTQTSGTSGKVLSLLRIVASLCFMEHGTMKLLGFPHGPMPQPPLLSLFGAAGILELVGGFMLLIGVFSRPVAFLLSGEMAIAYFMVHAPQSFFPALNMGEPAVLYAFIFLYLSTAGGGTWSVDTLFRKA